MKDGKNNVLVTLGTTGGAFVGREKDDYYATDPVAVRWLMQLEHLDHNVWECACGEGHLAKPLIEAGYNVTSTDLIYRNFGRGG